MKHAAMATAANNAEIAAKVMGSAGVTPNNIA
jgi:hypothetical protein